MSQAYITIDAHAPRRLRDALRALRSQFGTLDVSATWCSGADAEEILHLAACFYSILPVSDLIAALDGVAARCEVHIALVLLGSAVVDDGPIHLPLPALANNKAWLRALAGLAPGLQHPATGRGFADMADALPDNGLRPWPYNIE